MNTHKQTHFDNWPNWTPKVAVKLCVSLEALPASRLITCHATNPMCVSVCVCIANVNKTTTQNSILFFIFYLFFGIFWECCCLARAFFHVAKSGEACNLANLQLA